MLLAVASISAIAQPTINSFDRHRAMWEQR